MEHTAYGRKTCFIEEEEDDGLASLAEMEAGVSGVAQNGVVSSPFCYTRRNSFRSMNYYHYYRNHFSVSAPRSVVSGRFHDSRFEHESYAHHQPYFLDYCFLCKKPLGDNRDIYMYRGDTPFCSEECRQEQIERDEAKEKKQSLSSSMKAMRRKEQRNSSPSPSRSPDYTFHAGTVAAA